MTTTNTSPTPVTQWHQVLLWFLGAVVILAIAYPAPQTAIMIMLILIVLTLLVNWKTYAGFLGIPQQ